jgi:SAM-dependent methyltransferase
MSLGAGHAMALRLLRDACPPPSVVVDAGAYPGTLTRVLAAEGWTVVALDAAPDRDTGLQQAFNRREAFHFNDAAERPFHQEMRRAGVTVHAVDLEHDTFPCEGESADAVLMTEVIEHLWANPLHTLAEINRILRHDGALIVSTPNLLSLRNRVHFLRGDMNALIEHPGMAYIQKNQLGHTGHVRLYSAEELRGLLQMMGFEPSVIFFKPYFWDDPVAAPVSGNGDALARRRPRWLKTPREFVGAIVATANDLAERWYPPFRGHLFVVARKRRPVDLASLTASEATQHLRPR